MKKLIVANWKSNKSREQAERWMDRFGELIKIHQAGKGLNSTVVICPPMPSLMFVSNRLLDRQLFNDVFLGVQDISPFPAGSYTGAVSGQNLEGFRVRYAIVGHSERRRHFDETAQDVANKVDQCLEYGITPIVCVDHGEIAQQAHFFDETKRKKLVVAYEPHEYIGTGVIQDVAEILDHVSEIKAAFGDVPVLYGASVNPDTMDELKTKSEIAGFLVGTASLDAEEFVQII